MRIQTTDNWQQSNLQVFWSEIAPADHVLQIYERDEVFMDSLEGFVGSGLVAGDAVILIATTAHLEELETRLDAHGFDLASLVRANRYQAWDAQETLDKFMKDGWPDENIFTEVMTGLLRKAQRNTKRKVRAFGEMVALLWQQGATGATIQLEKYWNKLQRNENFSLFCAYPKTGFSTGMEVSLETICCAHSKQIHGEAVPLTEIHFKES